MHNTGGKYKSQYKTRIKGPYYRIKTYIDPIQDDNLFGEHQINYTNSWNGDETRYTSKKYHYTDTTPAQAIENL